MKKRVNISLDEEIVDKLKKLADEEYKSVSQWITDAVVRASKKEQNCNKKR